MEAGVLGACLSASFKLIFVCVGSGWLLNSGLIPEETASVLSKVAYVAMIPCMLFCKCAATLAEQPSLQLLGLPLVAMLQILMGAVLGAIAARSMPRNEPETQLQTGWHPRNPAPSSQALAVTSSAASGLPTSAAIPQRQQPAVPEGTQQMVACSCAFGNSLTLPLVFLMSLLPGHAVDRATGYIALFMIGWSPMLWSFGYQMMGGAMPSMSKSAGKAYAGHGKGRVNRLENFRLRPTEDPQQSSLERQAAGQARESWLVTACKRAHQFALKVLNPPLLGVLAGVVVGLSPLGKVLFGPVPASKTSLPWEMQALVGSGRAAVSMMGTIGGATLASQAIVLGASMFKQDPEEQTVAKQVTSPGGGRRHSLDWLKLVIPRDALEKRMLATVAVVRLLVLPFLNMLVVTALVRVGALPADPVCQLALMVEGAMPSAQNLVLLMQLRESTQPMAPRMAQLLLRMYALCVIPVTLWMGVFVGKLPVRLSAL
eukprot:jgi/Astpho2/8288/fgenesh1_pg.00122_%23_53_t